jgi:opacity protein-like surface antigen
MKHLILAMIAVVAGTLSGNAADLDRSSIKDTFAANVPAIQEVGRAGFGGGYVGASVNWSSLDVGHSGSIDARNCDKCERNDEWQFASGTLPGMSADEFSGGIQAGYNFEIGSVYVGPVVKFDLGGPSASLNRTIFDDPRGRDGDVTGAIDFEVNWSATVAAKLGVQVLDRVGVYGLIGVGFVDVDARGSAHMDLSSLSIGGAGVRTDNHSETVTAFAYGAGVDVKITDRWRAFAEWQRFDLDTFNANGSVLLDCIKYGYKADTDLDVVRVGLNAAF